MLTFSRDDQQMSADSLAMATLTDRPRTDRHEQRSV